MELPEFKLQQKLYCSDWLRDDNIYGRVHKCIWMMFQDKATAAEVAKTA